MTFDAEQTPFEMLGGADALAALAQAFYDHMEAHEPALAATHRLDPQGRITTETRERFALFLMGWLGGPPVYMATYGHPRLRMRHAHVRIDEAMRDAWVRSMTGAMDQCSVVGPVRTYLDERFAHVADFLRNVE